MKRLVAAVPLTATPALAQGAACLRSSLEFKRWPRMVLRDPADRPTSASQGNRDGVI